MTTSADYEARILPAVRRAVSKLSAEDWGLFAWAFNRRVQLFAQLTLLDMSDEDVSILSKAEAPMQTYYPVLDVVERKVGGRDHALAHLIVAMYHEARSHQAVPRP